MSSRRITPSLRKMGHAWRRFGRWIRGVERADLNRGDTVRSDWQTRRPAPERPPVPAPDIAALKRDYAETGLDRAPETFVLYRIIGNDLYPRHRRGQSRENLRFILDHEPELEACEKRWVVNRIVDAEEEAAILELLAERRQACLRIPFDKDAYRQVPWDFETFPEPGFFLRGRYWHLSEFDRARAGMQARRRKNNYAMNNNGARNAALADGRGRAKWVLPWDGNCFFTGTGWSELVQAVREKPYFKYFVVPMARITDNRSLLEPGFRPEATEEPQILFRRDAAEAFDEAVPYGRRPKVELFWRLGVSGGWDQWEDDVWDLPRPGLSREAGQFARAGWVARLYSGRGQLEASSVKSFVARGIARVEAVCTTLDRLDEEALLGVFDPQRLTAYDEAALAALGSRKARGQSGDLPARLRAEADAALTRGPYSVIDKTSLPPSGDPHDYWHPAPYWWPNPSTADGLPYLHRDGQRVPGTRLYAPESDRYDRTRLQRLFDDTTILALAWRATAEARYAEHAAALVRYWFIAPGTRMNPHLRYAQVRRGHDDDEGQSHGVIEMKDFYFFLDAVRLLARSGALDASDQDAFSEWLRHYLDWLRTSPQGRKERQASNNHGTCYDLQVAAIAAFLGEHALLLATLHTSQERLLEQFAPDGAQPHELARTQTQHYCCFNLQSWANLAALYESCGLPLWAVSASDGRCLRSGFAWLAPFMAGAEWRWPQSEPFDRERYWPLYFAARAHCDDLPGLKAIPAPDHAAAEPLYDPHDGIQPFWNCARQLTRGAKS